jgi:hypothetical protein
MKTNNSFKRTKPVCMIFVVLLLVSVAGQAWGAHLAAYYDARYPTNWADELTAIEVRDGLTAAGYEILDADQLKAWMDARINDHAASVVVFCQDIPPDTIVKTYTADCTLRQYLNAGGKIVVYADIPLWNVGHADNTRTTWWEHGLAGVLDIQGMNWRNATNSEVTITDAGIECRVIRAEDLFEFSTSMCGVKRSTHPASKTCYVWRSTACLVTPWPVCRIRLMVLSIWIQGSPCRGS